MPTFAEDRATFWLAQITKYETLLASNVGVTSISVDGQSVSYGDLQKFYNNAVKQYRRWNGDTSVAMQINLNQ